MSLLPIMQTNVSLLAMASKQKHIRVCFLENTAMISRSFISFLSDEKPNITKTRI